MPELIAFVLASAVALVLPGMALLNRLPERRTLEFRWAYAVGLSLAVTPILFLLLRLLEIPAVPATFWVIYLASALSLLPQLRTALKGFEKFRPPVSRWSSWPLALAALFVACFALRLSSVQGLPVLPGADANAHALIGKLFLENRGIPSNFLPYVPLSSFTYHFGAHANSAVLSMISGLPIHRVQVLFEPFLLGLMALTTVVLAEKLTGNRRAAFAAGILVAFIAPFPAWYINWARLPQLAAMVLLPLVIVAYLNHRPSGTMAGADTGGGSAPPERLFTFQPLLWLLSAGLVLTHYRIGIVLAYALVALWIRETVLARPEERTEVFFTEFKRSFAAFAPAVILILPWVPGVLQSFGFDNVGSPAGSELPPMYFYSLARIQGIWTIPTTIPFLVIATAGIILNFVRLSRGFLFLFYWTVVMVAFSHPHKVPLPWAGLVDFITVLSILSLPLAIVGGDVFAALADKVKPALGAARSGRRSAAYGLLLLAVAAAGTVGSRDLVPSGVEYVGPADLVAFEWVKQNTSKKATFLSPIVTSSSGIIQPTDAGSWLAYFSGRRQATPLALYLSEESTSPTYEADLTRLVSAVPSLDSDPAKQELWKQGVTHIYFGSRFVSRVRHPTTEAGYKLVYDRDGAKIYEVPAEQP